MALEINSLDDWKTKLADQGLTTVVDPMVLRCGELFLRGSRSFSEKEPIWDLLNKNIISLAMFFDSLVLDEKIPVFNYGDTYDRNSNVDQQLFPMVNNVCEALQEVDVCFAAYHAVKDKALADLGKLIRGTNRVTPEMANDILGELASAEYHWDIGLENLQHELQNQEDRKLAVYLLGALIFGGYAQIMEGEHVLQPKRSLALLRMGWDTATPEQRKVEELFMELKTRANTPMEDLPWRPTFFPYLLEKADSPMRMLDEVKKLRESDEVKEYRTWYRGVVTDLQTNGYISPGKKAEVRGMAETVDRRIKVVSSSPEVEIKFSVANVIAAILTGNPVALIPGEINLTRPAQALWGWVLEGLPGRSYRKLLSRAVATDHNYELLENRVETVWKAG